MQIVRFSTGGYALHKLTVIGRQCSAWYDSDGNLLDMEYTGSDPFLRRAIKQGSRHWKKAQHLGRTYRDVQAIRS